MWIGHKVKDECMSKIKNSLLAGVAALGFATSAVAADLPVKSPTYANTGASPFNWTGFYFGLEAGYGFAAQDIGLNSTILQNPGSIGSNATGGIGGINAGFLYQFSPMWAWGVEARFDATSIKADGNVANVGSILTTSLPWEGSVVGRLGIIPEQRLFLYGLGGVAFGEVKQSVPAAVMTGLQLSADNVHVGWTAGAGIEYAFTQSLIGGLEYRYVNLGSHGVCDPTLGCAVFNPTTTAAYNEVMGRLKVKF